MVLLKFPCNVVNTLNDFAKNHIFTITEKTVASSFTFWNLLGLTIYLPLSGDNSVSVWNYIHLFKELAQPILDSHSFSSSDHPVHVFILFMEAAYFNGGYHQR